MQIKTPKTRKRRGLALVASVFVAALSQPLFAVEQPPAASTDGAAIAEPVSEHQEPACASDGSVLGLSRVVEIDATGGPEFGSVNHKDTDFLKDGEVVLTFDDGPLRPYTSAVLKALAAHCTKATFFVVGRMAMSDPEMVKKVAAAGHTIASHTWSHKNLKNISGERGIEEMELGASAVSLALGRPIAPFFRFPYLSAGKAALAHVKGRDVASFWIDIDSVDYRTKDPATVHHRVMAQLKVKRKGIILMHDIQRSTAGAIQGLLDDLHAQGYKVVHLVPKGSLSTVATYDTEVAARFAAKTKKAGKAGSLSDRSIVWSADPEAAKAAASKEVLPWQTGGSTASPATTPQAKPQAADSAKQRDEELPWKMQIFGQ